MKWKDRKKDTKAFLFRNKRFFQTIINSCEKKVKFIISPFTLQPTIFNTMDKLAWKKLKCRKAQLCLDFVLQCGQSFRWKKSDDGIWTGVAFERLWQLKQDQEFIFFKSVGLEQC